MIAIPFCIFIINDPFEQQERKVELKIFACSDLALAQMVIIGRNGQAILEMRFLQLLFKYYNIYNDSRAEAFNIEMQTSKFCEGFHWGNRLFIRSGIMQPERINDRRKIASIKSLGDSR